jgi:putative acetyltransferase
VQNELTIRPERPEDHDAIAAVVAAAFKSEAEARLVELIRASPHFVPDLSLVAERDGAIVGHVMLSYSALHSADGVRPVLQLSPLAVAPEHQSEGIGGALVREGVRRAEERGEPIVVLEGSPVYYGRFGFEHSALHGIELPIPDWAPPEASQVMRLTAYDPSMRGRVVYPPAFDDVTEH